MIAFSTSILVIFGLLNLFGLNKNLFLKQLVFTIFSFVVFFIIRKYKNFILINNKKIFYWFFIVLLIITYIIGVEVKGSLRWLDLGLFRIQPSEIFKPFFILFLADFLSREFLFSNYYYLIFRSFVYFFIPFFIIFKQPDLANGLTYLVIYLVLIFFSKIPKKYLVSFFSIFLIFVPIFWFLLKDYQRYRLLVFLNPSIDIQGISYNLTQSIITIGSGGFFGRGLGLGTQSKLYFLPENTTDFAFASLVEQFGFFGGLIIIIFYFLIFIDLFKKLLFYYKNNKSKKFDKINFYYLLGLISYLGFQFFVNIGMNMGLLPIAGVSLPFISYGGSSVLALLIGLALVY